MMSNTGVKLNITADTKQINLQLNNLNKKLQTLGKTPLAAAGTARVVKGLDSVNRKASQSTRQVERLARGIRVAFNVVAIAAFTRAVGRAGDSIRNLNNSLKASGVRADELGQSVKFVLQMSNETRSSFAQAGVLLSRMTRSTKSLGVSTKEVQIATKAISQAFVIQGATTAEATGAVIQLSQGLASGTLRGEELNSVLESGTLVAEAIAKQLGVGLGELRALAKEGKITSEVVFQALLNDADQLNETFSKLKPTFEGAFNVFQNGLTAASGEVANLVGEALGLQQAFQDIGIYLSNAFLSGNITVGVGEMISDVRLGFAEVKATIQDIFDGEQSLGSLFEFDFAIPTYDDIHLKFKAVSDNIIKAVAEFFGADSDTAVGVADAFSGGLGVAMSGSGFINDLLVAWGEDGTIYDALDASSERFKRNWKDFIDGIEDTVGDSTTGDGLDGDKLAPLNEKVEGWVSSFTTRMTKFLGGDGDTSEALGDLAGSITAFKLSVRQLFLDGFLNLFTEGEPDPVSGETPSWLSKIEDSLALVKEKLREMFQNLFKFGSSIEWVQDIKAIFDNISTAFSDAFNDTTFDPTTGTLIKTSKLTAMIDNLIRPFKRLYVEIKGIFADLAELFETPEWITNLTGSLGGVIDEITTLINQLLEKFGLLRSSLPSTNSSTSSSTGSSTGSTESTGSVLGVPNTILPLGGPLMGLGLLLNNISADAEETNGSLGFLNTGLGGVNSTIGTISPQLDGITTSFRELDEVLRLLDAKGKTSSSIAEQSAHVSVPSTVQYQASGGYIRGAGTSTSDSIPAMLSNGEFVMQASAVQKFGTGFMSALNNGRLVQAFSGGGLAQQQQQNLSFEIKKQAEVQSSLDTILNSQSAGQPLTAGDSTRVSAYRRDIAARQERIEKLRTSMLSNSGEGSSSSSSTASSSSSGNKKKRKVDNRTAAQKSADSYADEFHNAFSKGLSDAIKGDENLAGVGKSLLNSLTGSIIDSFSEGLTESLLSGFTGENGILSNFFQKFSTMGNTLSGGAGTKDTGRVDKNNKMITETINGPLSALFNKHTDDMGTTLNGFSGGFEGILTSFGTGFSGLLKGIGSIFSGGSSSGGFLGSLFKIGGTAAVGMSQGGIVPTTRTSRIGADSVPAMLMPGELVVPKSQVNNLRNSSHGGSQQTFNMNIQGDVSRATKKTVYSMMNEIAGGVNASNRENNIK